MAARPDRELLPYDPAADPTATPFDPAAESVPYIASPRGLFPREPYELELWFHLAASYELLVAAGYPRHSNKRLGLKLPYKIEEGLLPDSELRGSLIAAGTEWVRKWVLSSVADRMADVIRFANDDEAQMWMHSWLRVVKGTYILYNNWGASTVGMMMGVEDAVLEWVNHLHSHFYRRTHELGSLDGRLRMDIDTGFQFCPRLAANTRHKPPSQRRFKMFHQDCMPHQFRIGEKLAYLPDMYLYGSLDPAHAQPATHLEFMASVSPHDQLASQGDVGLMYSANSHTLTHDQRVAALAIRARDEPGTVREECILSAMRPEDVLDKAGVTLSEGLGTKIHRSGGRTEMDVTKCPLWVGPPRRADLPSGCILAWPSNLVHGFPHNTGRQATLHLSRRICYINSYQPFKENSNGSGRLWSYCWGVDDMAGSQRDYKGIRTQSDDPEVLLRRVSADVSHHAKQGPRAKKAYTNNNGFHFMFCNLPDVRIFFSLPVQMARFLQLRFPDVFPPTASALALAKDLIARRAEWQAPVPDHPATRMVRRLWGMFK